MFIISEKHIMKNNKKIISTLFFIAILTGCASDSDIKEQPEKIYYDLAQQRMLSGNFMGAIELLELIETNYPFGKYAEQAKVELIYAHYMNNDSIASHANSEQFIRLNPRHPNIDYAYFMRGLSSYTGDRGLTARISEDISIRDVSGAKISFGELNEFITRFPDSQYVPFAKQRSIYLRNIIAANELAVADYYISRNAYVASVRRARYVIENIPNSNQNLRALKILEVCYEKLGYVDLQDEIKAIIALNYPNSST